MMLVYVIAGNENSGSLSVFDNSQKLHRNIINYLFFHVIIFQKYD